MSALADKLSKAIRDGMDRAGTLPAKDSVKVVPKDWHNICRLAGEASSEITRLQAELDAAREAGKVLQSYIESRPQDAFYEVKYRPANIDAALRVFRALDTGN